MAKKIFDSSLWLLCVLFMIFLPADFKRSFFVLMIYVLLSLSLSLVFRATGILNLGQGMSFALGAYGFMVGQGGVKGVCLGIMVVIAYTFMVLFVLGSLEPMGYAIGSICFMGISEELIRVMRSITGGTDGIYLKTEMGTEKAIIVLVLVISALFSYMDRCMSGKMGYQGELLRLDENVARSLGVSVEGARFRAILASSIATGLGGICLAMAESYVNLSSVFSPRLTLIPLVTAMVAKGKNSIIFYAFIFWGIQELLGVLGLNYESTLLGILVVSMGYSMMRKEELDELP